MDPVGIGDVIPDAVLDASVFDQHGEPMSVRALIDGRPTALVFLRHFGCIGCSMHVSAIRPRVPELRALGVQVVFVGNGDPLNIAGFLQRHALAAEGVTIVSDPSLAVYRAASLRRAWSGSLGPRALVTQLRAMGEGWVQHAGDGDGAQQGGVLLIDARGVVQYCHRSQYIADNADAGALVNAALIMFARRDDAALAKQGVV